MSSTSKVQKGKKRKGTPIRQVEKAPRDAVKEAKYEQLRFSAIDDLADLIHEASRAIACLVETDMPDTWVKKVKRIAQNAENKLSE